MSVREDVVIPGEFRNLQVILENEGWVRTIFCAARMFLLHQAKGFCISGCNDLDGNTLVSVALFRSVDIHYKGDERFSVHSRRKQCAFIPPKLVVENNI